MTRTVHIPWYATVFRGDKLEQALNEISAVSLRYGATGYAVYRYDDDRYKFLQVFEFASKQDFARFWDGPEFIDFRVLNSSYFQVPVVYGWADQTAADSVGIPAPAAAEVEPVAEGDLAG
jgi:hypothetical protein